MKTCKWVDRPKWARPLNFQLWSDLHECQGKVPTLRDLKADVALQERLGMLCWTCKTALNKVTGGM